MTLEERIIRNEDLGTKDMWRTWFGSGFSSHLWLQTTFWVDHLVAAAIIQYPPGCWWFASRCASMWPVRWQCRGRGCALSVWGLQVWLKSEFHDQNGVVSCDKLKNFVVHFGSTTSIIFSFIFIISPLMVHVMKMAILCQIWAFLGPRPLYHHEVVGFVGKQYADGPTPIISIFWVNKHPLPSHLRVGFWFKAN